MNKQQIIEILQEKKTELSALSDKIAKSSCMKEEGHIVSRTIKGKLRLYEKNGTAEKYLGCDKKGRIRVLAEKAYAIQLDKAARMEKSQLDACVRILESGKKKDVDYADVEQVHHMLPDHIRENCNPSSITDDRYAEKWQAEKYQNRWKAKDDYTYETTRGEKVRSKSEWIIAGMLADAGVPYRYEETVALSPEFGVFLYPDFTVLNKRTRKVYYWEHFGKMDDSKYIEGSFMPKISDYYNFEFLPGDKLLMTFESKHKPLDTTEVKRIIDTFLK